MLDVHPPHSPTHTWKDFLIHIATIVVGLLIAIGLEQTVEAIHQHRERHELMEQLDAEHRQVLNNAEDTNASRARGLNWYAARMEEMEAVLTRQRPVAIPPSSPSRSSSPTRRSNTCSISTMHRSPMTQRSSTAVSPRPVAVFPFSPAPFRPTTPMPTSTI